MVILLSADQIFRTQGVDYRIGGYNKTDVNGYLLTADKIYYRCKKQSAKQSGGLNKTFLDGYS